MKTFILVADCLQDQSKRDSDSAVFKATGTYNGENFEEVILDFRCKERPETGKTYIVHCEAEAAICLKTLFGTALKLKLLALDNS